MSAPRRRISELLRLHIPDRGYCTECGQPHPCRTVQVAKGRLTLTPTTKTPKDQPC